ncbi:D-glycero-beta-D-manno-heptose 1,7-bisphosphate 7-phosphatase [Fusobacterium sp.]|uniref:D-glycero-beta-D-manno-heptose 1,7-bisphosphate 7-phosphatase n=1 Tax=Fusobacterium sp. TaxID=68766 RepID=UPI00290419DE|nr:D-glycero-beta-D-manno-heptose 1,7-bisphosphate 7-phosphatase [Fusobacterium sp.]MDU1912106.1 D-glycero-beta-D-manno-heptose 1,7-bisphosphate 7-phosphatase [Fusobacterium sp.]
MKKAILLDRDGTINVEKDYLHKIEDFEFEKNVVEALKIFSSLGYTMAVVTNQSGIARGYYTEKDLEKLNEYIKKELEKQGVIIEKFYYCPHHPENGVGKYKIDCICRKPNTGMLEAAIKEFDIDRRVSFMVGDTIADIDAGSRAGLTPILVKTGHGMETLEKIGDRKIDIFDSLYDFALSLK